MKYRDDAGLYDYQREMKDSLYTSWAEVRSVMCQMPTGTGKTHLLMSVVRDYVRSGGNAVWIVVHRIELVEQISSTLSRYGVPHGRIVSGAPRSGEAVRVVSIQTLSSLIERGKLQIELCGGDFAYVEESPLVRYYVDLKTFERYEKRPELFTLDFLEFVCYEGCYFLRMHQRRWKTVPCFTRDDLHIEGGFVFPGGHLHPPFFPRVMFTGMSIRTGMAI